MPKVKRTRKPPPDGWELIEPTIDELDAKMREGLYSDTVVSISQFTNVFISFICIFMTIDKNIK